MSESEELAEDPPREGLFRDLPAVWADESVLRQDVETERRGETRLRPSLRRRITRPRGREDGTDSLMPSFLCVRLLSMRNGTVCFGFRYNGRTIPAMCCVDPLGPPSKADVCFLITESTWPLHPHPLLSGRPWCQEAVAVRCQRLRDPGCQ